MNLAYVERLNSVNKIKTFIKFSFSSGLGVFINLLLTFILTEGLFGKQHYFYAYTIGLTVGLLVQFIMHIKYTFKKSIDIKKKFGQFMSYSVIMTLIQASTVKAISDVLGVDYYIFIIAFVICIFYIINYLVNSKVVFK